MGTVPDPRGLPPGFELFEGPDVLATLAHPTRQRIYVAAVNGPEG
jgi:hypothetical protein